MVLVMLEQYRCHFSCDDGCVLLCTSSLSCAFMRLLFHSSPLSQMEYAHLDVDYFIGSLCKLYADDNL